MVPPLKVMTQFTHTLFCRSPSLRHLRSVVSALRALEHPRLCASSIRVPVTRVSESLACHHRFQSLFVARALCRAFGPTQFRLNSLSSATSHVVASACFAFAIPFLAVHSVSLPTFIAIDIDREFGSAVHQHHCTRLCCSYVCTCAAPPSFVSAFALRVCSAPAYVFRTRRSLSTVSPLFHSLGIHTSAAAGLRVVSAFSVRVVSTCTVCRSTHPCLHVVPVPCLCRTPPSCSSH